MLSPAQLPPPLLLALTAVFGAAIGSFISLVTYRLPRGEPIGMTRSRCPRCSTRLRLADLVPVFSWAWHRGRCRHCHAPVSIRYPLTELACALGAVGLVYHFGPTLPTLALVGLWWSAVALTVTDLEHYLILDEVQVVIGATGALYVWATNGSPTDAAVAAFTGAAIGLALKYGFLFLRGKDGLGLGDVKFLFVAGIWLADAKNFIPFLFFSGLCGVAFGLCWRALTGSQRFPFGPALMAALLACVVAPWSAQGFWNLYGLLP